MKIKTLLISLFCTSFFPLLLATNIRGEEETTISTTEIYSLLDSIFNNKGVSVEDAVEPEQLQQSAAFSNSSQGTESEKDSFSSPEKEQSTQIAEELTETKLPDFNDANEITHSSEVVLLEEIDSDNFEQNYQEIVQSNPPFEPIVLDSINFARNPLFSELVYMGKDIHLNWKEMNVDHLLRGGKPRTLSQPFDSIDIQHPTEILTELRKAAINYITQTAPELYRTTFDRLPEINWVQQYRTIEITPREQFLLNENYYTPAMSSSRITIRKKEVSLWQCRTHALLQFSQIAVSENWHQSGNNFFSLLGVLSGNFNYNNKKKTEWENKFEWRTGFNTVTGDTIANNGKGRKAMPSDDVLKINSKFGLKATGNFYYSTSLEFQTQFFNNPAGINNFEMRARFLTPVRLNIGVGMDYKYKNLSVALSPLSFKHVYLTDTTTTSDGFFINPNAFSIETGQNQLREFGSKLIVELKNYRPVPELRLHSKFNFYTNYEEVEIDWEIIAELFFNRFFSARLMLNPRFDNTVISENDQSARIQMKEMITVGFSYRIL